MIKKLIAVFILFTAVFVAGSENVEKNLEYGDENSISLPLPYQESKHKGLVVNSVPIYLNNYGTIVKQPPSQVASTSGGFLSFVGSYAYKALKIVALFIFHNLPVLMLSAALYYGVCQLTPLCSMMSNVFTPNDDLKQMKSKANPDQINTATELFHKAIKTYHALQNS